MQGPARPRHLALGARTKMVGVDLESHAVLPRGIDDKIGREARQRLGERGRGSAVEEPVRLLRPVIYRHRAAEKIRSELDDLDPEVLDHAALAAGVDVFDGIGAVPEGWGHGGGLTEREALFRGNPQPWSRI